MVSVRSRFLLSAVLMIALPTSVVAVVMLDLFNPHAIHETGKYPLDVAVGDIDKDGAQDVLTANRNGSSISVFLGDGQGGLSPSEELPTELGATSLALADMDKDSVLDIVVSLCTPNNAEHGITVWRGSGDGTFTPGSFVSVEGTPYNLSVADFDDDGNQDIAASNYPGNEIILLFGTGTLGQFEEQRLPTGKRPIALLVDDINGDGRMDLMSSDHTAASSTVYLNEGSRRFTTRITVPTGELPYSIALAHLDDDRVLDLAVAQSSDPGMVRLFHGNGDGTFDPWDSFTTDDRLIFVAAQDFNSDQRADLIVTRHKKSHASVFLSQANGGFDHTPHHVHAENEIYSLAIADLNGDPFPDLVTVDFLQSTLSVSLGADLNALPQS